MPNRRRLALALGALPALPGAGLLLSGCSETVTAHGPARVANGVLRLASDQGDRLAFLTSQWERRHVYLGGLRTGGSRRSVAHLHIDFWLVDVATARPLRRVRLRTDKQLGDVAVLGADRGILWARLPDLIGLRLADGSVVADRARVAAANPALASVLPQPPDRTLFLTPQQQRLRFTLADGLVMLLDDGRRVRLDPSTLQAHVLGAAAEAEPEAATTAQRRRALAPANGMQWNAMVRGLNIARADRNTERNLDWLGLVAEREVAQIAREGQTTSVPDFTRPERFKLYRGRLRPETTHFGVRHRLELVQPLPEAPEFLFAGLAVEDPQANPTRALWRRDPDSVFVLHRDRLGDAGRWLLSRIAGPAGRVVWRAELPLSDVGLWLPGEPNARHALLLGTWLNAPRSPWAEEREDPSMQIASVDLDTGAMAAFNLDVERNWPLTPI
jgi:hypothetical protein